MTFSSRTKSAVAESVKTLLVEAEEIARQKKNELDAARRRLQVAREASSLADGEVKRLARALSVLEASTTKIGRPRGGAPDGVIERVRSLLPEREEWSGVALRAKLAEEGVDVPANRVSAALARLATEGFAVRVTKGVWATAPTEGTTQ